MDFVPRFRVKTVESMADPSDYVTVHVKAPQVAVRRPALVASESVQLKTLAALLTLYDKTGEVNLVLLILRVSVKQGLVTKIVKSFF